MEPSPLTTRRATLDDLPALLALWERRGLPGIELEKFLTEFQVVLAEDGSISAALGLLIDGHEGLLHSEAIADEGEADAARAALWHRLKIVARNQGATRLWTQEDAAFWQSVLAKATPAEVDGLKARFADPSVVWYVHPLIDPERAQQMVTEQLAVWEASRASERDDLQRRISGIRYLALVIAAIVIGLIALMAVYLFSHRQSLQQMFGR